MNRKIIILGKRFLPVWLLSLLLIASGMGAAVGTVLAGKVTGDVPVAVSQALLTDAPAWLSLVSGNYTAPTNAPQQVRVHDDMVSTPNRYFGAVADDNTAFQAAAEMATGDWTVFYLPLKNASENPLIGLLTLSVPECLEVEVYSAANNSNVTEVVRIGVNTWKFTLDYDAEYANPADALAIVVSVDDTCTPGYYTISGVMNQIPY